MFSNNFLRWDKSRRRQSRSWISSERPSEKQNVRLGFMDFIMDPSSALLDSETAPFKFIEQSGLCHFSEDFFWEDDVAVFVGIVFVFFWVFNFAGEVRHFFKKRGGIKMGFYLFNCFNFFKFLKLYYYYYYCFLKQIKKINKLNLKLQFHFFS